MFYVLKVITKKYNNIVAKMQGYSASLKKKATKAEKALMVELDRRGVRYKFQAYFHDSKVGFIVDFLLRKINTLPLVVEVDGDSHNSERAKKYDEWRRCWLKEKRNCRMIRFSNEEVFNNVVAVVSAIIEEQGNFFKSDGHQSPKKPLI